MATRVIVYCYTKDFKTQEQAMQFAYSLIQTGCYSSFSISPIPDTEMHVTTSKPISYFCNNNFAKSLAQQYGDFLEDCPFIRLLDITQVVLDEMRDCDYGNAELFPFLAGLLAERSRKRSYPF